MLSASRSLQVASAILCAGLLTGACGDNDSQDAGFAVTTEVVSHETTRDVLVFAPDSSGPWPVVLVMHGVRGTGQDMAEVATRLAAKGFVVFSPTFSTDLSSQEGSLAAVTDAECAYRFARSIAAEHGGDLDQPVTFVGWSLGASFVLQGGLIEEVDPTGEFLSCFAEVPRADLIVAISGCHYEFEGTQSDFDTSGWGNKDADVVLLAGDEDTICAAWQSENATAELRSAGYNVDLVILEGASHFAPIFHDLVDGDLVVVADDPAGDQTINVILDTIKS